MQTLEPSDRHHLSAVEGWFELGNLHEAMVEWERLSPHARRHPVALELRWRLHAQRGEWDRALEVAEEMVTRAPELRHSWLHRSYAMRRAPGGGLEKAWAALRPAADRFPDEELIAYNLACYATQLGRLDEGWEWFLRAMQITGDGRRIRRMALVDEDLQPLWERIRGLA